MAVTLSKLCANTEKTYDMRLIAGKNGMDNHVRWVHILEDIEVPEFLHGNELVFTTGIGHSGSDSEWIYSFIKSLHSHKAAGVVVNIGPYIHDVPRDAVLYCEENGFPLFTVPWAVHLIDVTYDFCHRIIANEENELSLAVAFRNLIFSPDEKETYYHVLRRHGFRDDSSYVITVANMEMNGSVVTARQWQGMQFAIRKILGKSIYPFFMFLQENHLVIIRQRCAEEDAETLAQKLCAEIGEYFENTRFYIGLSNVNPGYFGVYTGYKEAMSAMQVAKLRKLDTVRYSQIGVYKLLLNVGDVQLLREFYEKTLGALDEFDLKNSTDYMETLFCYLQNNGSVSDVAAIMKVHRNTVNYKMKAIRKILGIELTTEQQLAILLAFHIRNLLEN